MRTALLVIVWLASLALVAPARGATGREIFFSRGCNRCHQIEGPATEKSIADRLARKGPELWYAGSKFKEGFLRRWLSEPVPIRPLEYNSLVRKNRGAHARLGPSEAGRVAGYLMSLKSKAVKTGVIRPAVNPRGRVLFIRKLACYGCHRVRSRGKMVGGLSAPSLAGASARLNPDWIFAYLSNPDVFKPVRAMPSFVGIINEKDMAALAAYVGTL